jgi:hypothetical protein
LRITNFNTLTLLSWADATGGVGDRHRFSETKILNLHIYRYDSQKAGRLD